MLWDKKNEKGLSILEWLKNICNQYTAANNFFDIDF